MIMGNFNYRQQYAIKEQNKKRILKVCPSITEQSGVYFLTRYEDGFKYAYIGQAKNLLSRLADHLNGYQHIDISLKKHGFYSNENLTGWHINFIECENLDEMEQKLIKEYANSGYQMRNKTVGGQGKGKNNLVDKVVKGYQNGLTNGYNKAREQLAELLTKVDYNFSPRLNKNGLANTNSLKAIEKINNFIGK